VLSLGVSVGFIFKVLLCSGLTIDDFRTFYKPKENTELVNIQALIEQSISFVQNAIDKKGIVVVNELEHIEYKLYQNEFIQVMLNLIKNAIDAIDNNGIIVVKLYKEDTKVIVSVQNDGVCISGEDMMKIFEPYYTTKKESMGLGLYMAKIIIQTHMKGSIVVGENDNQTIFRIELPLV